MSSTNLEIIADIGSVVAGLVAACTIAKYLYDKSVPHIRKSFLILKFRFLSKEEKDVINNLHNHFLFGFTDDVTALRKKGILVECSESMVIYGSNQVCTMKLAPELEHKVEKKPIDII